MRSDLQIVIGLRSIGSKDASTSTGKSNATSSTSTSPKVTTSGMTEGNKVSKGKKVATPEIVDIDYNIVEDMKKTRENVFVFELSIISAHQEFIMKSWKDDKEYSSEEKGNTIDNLVKNVIA